MKTLSSALAISVAASGAYAQDVTYLTYGLGFSVTDSVGSDINATEVVGAVEYSINQFVLFADVNGSFFSGDFGNESVHDIKARVGYEFAPGSMVFGGVSSLSIFNDNLVMYELGGQYDFGTGQVGLVYNDLPDEDVAAVTLAGAYTVAPGSEIGASFTKLTDEDELTYFVFGTYENGPLSVDGSVMGITEFDLSVVNIGATYEFGGQYRAVGELSSLTGGGNNFTGVTAGIGYEISENLWIDATYTGYNEDDASAIGIALTFETGTRSLVTDRALDARIGAFSSFGPEGAILAPIAELGIPFGS